jgi:hypothetical protein
MRRYPPCIFKRLYSKKMTESTSCPLSGLRKPNPPLQRLHYGPNTGKDHLLSCLPSLSVHLELCISHYPRYARVSRGCLPCRTRRVKVLKLPSPPFQVERSMASSVTKAGLLVADVNGVAKLATVTAMNRRWSFETRMKRPLANMFVVVPLSRAVIFLFFIY